MSEEIQEMDVEELHEILKEKLTPKELKFCYYYIGEANFNGTRAAKMAGYTGNQSTLSTAAWKILKRQHVKDYMDAVLDQVAMPSNEILARLATIARCSIDDVLNNKDLSFDKKKANKNGAIHCVKKVKIKRIIKLQKTEQAGFDIFEDETPETTTEILHEEVEFEMYDAHAALRDLAKHKKLLTDKIDANVDVNQADVVFYIPENNRDSE